MKDSSHPLSRLTAPALPQGEPVFRMTGESMRALKNTTPHQSKPTVLPASPHRGSLKVPSLCRVGLGESPYKSAAAEQPAEGSDPRPPLRYSPAN